MHIGRIDYDRQDAATPVGRPVPLIAMGLLALLLGGLGAAMVVPPPAPAAAVQEAG